MVANHLTAVLAWASGSNLEYKLPRMNKKRIVLAAIGFIVALAFLLSSGPWASSNKKNYYAHQGKVFGTYYNIRYEATQDLESAFLDRLQAFDASLSTFNPQSTISAINQGRDTVLDPWFLRMYDTAYRISELSDGAFDITVAPLVNAWGFGFKNKETVTPELIDSIRTTIGYTGIMLSQRNDGYHLCKTHPATMLDASAIAKGYGCDVVAELLQEYGCTNYLVDIGGEVVLNGVNKEGKPWRVGITKPIDDVSGQQNEVQHILQSTHLCMATSGNYRQFYYEGGLRRSHTIDPRTGYPAESDLLSATIISTTCMQADALATACMVLGSEQALQLIQTIDSTECYLIISCPGDSLQVLHSDGFPL